jgi:AcrR family transcriptional regulator
MAKKKSTTNEKEFPKDLIFASTRNAPLVENRHQQIVEGASKVFLKKGYHQTTTRDIAKACGMSIGQLYHYISSKDDVLYLVHKHLHKTWHNYVEKSNLHNTDDPEKKLIEALDHILQFQVEHKGLMQFVYSESKHLSKAHFKAVMEMDCKNVLGFWRELLQEVNEKKPIKGDLDFLASLLAFIMVFIPLRGWTVRDKPISDVLDDLKEFVLKGLGFLH